MVNIKSKCNICGSSCFKKGPLERLALNGSLPQCNKCGSLERHRILRKAWSLIPSEYLSSKKSLQFSMDPSIDATKFNEFEVSIYGHTNSLDIEKISKNDNSYDITICNQILEHVENDTVAFSELLRITKNDGFLQFTVPNPILRQVTEDWGYPKKEFHGHYRHYGIDLIEKFSSVSKNYKMINIQAKDDVTSQNDYIFFWTKSKATQKFLLELFSNSNEIEIERYS